MDIEHKILYCHFLSSIKKLKNEYPEIFKDITVSKQYPIDYYKYMSEKMTIIKKIMVIINPEIRNMSEWWFNSYEIIKLIIMK